MDMGENMIEALTQFGAAGLIGMMWLLERRHNAKRDRQLDEAHTRLIAHGQEIELWAQVVRENTKALLALEQAQRELSGTLRRWRRRRPEAA